MTNLQFARVDSDGNPQPDGTQCLPTRAYTGDAGWDLYVSESVWVPAGQFRDIPCGVGVALPEDTWGMLTGRSSTLRNRGLLVHQGVIDQGYRGPLFAGVFNLGPDATLVEAGARIAQLIVIPMHDHQVEYVDRLRPGVRGSAGFGSSGS